MHQFGPNAGSINLSVVEIKEKENITTTLWWSSKNRGEDWNRENLIMPNITSKYGSTFQLKNFANITLFLGIFFSLRLEWECEYIPT